MNDKQEQLLIAAIQLDTSYQALLYECELLEKDYIRIRSNLSDTDQELLERYISACEELEHMKVHLAFSLR